MGSKNRGRPDLMCIVKGPCGSQGDRTGGIPAPTQGSQSISVLSKWPGRIQHVPLPCACHLLPTLCSQHASELRRSVSLLPYFQNRPPREMVTPYPAP